MAAANDVLPGVLGTVAGDMVPHIYDDGAPIHKKYTCKHCGEKMGSGSLNVHNHRGKYILRHRAACSGCGRKHTIHMTPSESAHMLMHMQDPRMHEHIEHHVHAHGYQTGDGFGSFLKGAFNTAINLVKPHVPKLINLAKKGVTTLAKKGAEIAAEKIAEKAKKHAPAQFHGAIDSAKNAAKKKAHGLIERGVDIAGNVANNAIENFGAEDAAEEEISGAGIVKNAVALNNAQRNYSTGGYSNRIPGTGSYYDEMVKGKGMGGAGKKGKAAATGKPLSAWAQFVKDNYDEVRDLPVKQRFGALAVMFNKA